ncbi:MAG: hypothetical protein DYG89_25050 [Caldilinea sp. CFX5]|nr:hypothetical protein [Caldilinea sp. CFX5]
MTTRNTTALPMDRPTHRDDWRNFCYTAGPRPWALPLRSSPPSILLAHAAWDAIHWWRNRVVARVYAEFCGVVDLPLGAAILVMP